MCGRGSKWEVVDVRGKVAQPARRVKDKRLRRAFGILDTARWLGFVMVKGVVANLCRTGLTLRSLGGERGLSATLSDCNYAAL